MTFNKYIINNFSFSNIDINSIKKDKLQIYKSISEYKEKDEDKKFLFNISFLSNEILEYIIFKCNTKYTFVNKNFKITIFNDKDDISYNFVNHIYNIINFIIYLFKVDKYLDLYIFVTPFKKELTEKTDIIGHNEVNSGASLSNYKYGSIYIWRTEEVFKVLIHELIHHYDIDLKNGNDYIANKIKQKLNLDKNIIINPNECYTEITALLLYLIYNNIFKNSKLNIKEFKNNLNNENKWSIYQISKILNKIGCYKSFNDLFNKNKDCKFKQNTNVLSYYILKGCLLFNFNKFLLFILSNKSLKFYNSKENYEIFFKLIYDSLKDKTFINSIDYNLNNNNFENKSMRMTIT